MEKSFNLGVVSDTHGLLRPQLVEALQGVDLILHAGDVGRADIIEKLKRIAPLHLVRGNVDCEEWAEKLPITEVVQVGNYQLYMIHNLAELELDPAAAKFSGVIFGHSHKPFFEKKNGVFYLNPGSAGPRRFSLPVGLARLRLGSLGMDVEWIELDV